ncbi:enkurin domain-containing protein 1-like isoform X1 [Tubulanus polymorphus]|uniref:enkurin domain-containing protein 1-like isoform X1 n=1 Tax=Tubulanus polymorphus TaxID=672921 RepID=UPI003DA5780C
MVSGGWTSNVQGPIPPHPYYDSRPQSEYIEKPAGRNRPEARNYAELGTKGTLGLMLKLEGTQIGPKPKFKSPPKDHIAENVKRMRRVQRISRQQQKQQIEDQPKPVKALWKSEKYANVPSKVGEEIKKEPNTPRPHSANYLRAHSRAGPPSRPPSRGAGVTPRLRLHSAERRSVPTAESAKDSVANLLLLFLSFQTCVLLEDTIFSVENVCLSEGLSKSWKSKEKVKMFHRDTDFIKVNGRAAKFYDMKRAPSLTALDDLKKKHNDDERLYRRGIVPEYLIHRQKEMADEEQRRIDSIPDPTIPDGHKVMDEKERVESLELLRKNQEALITQLNMLPITSDTMRVKNKRLDLEAKLSELEEAIRIFSRPKVFVKIDQ